MNQRPRRLRRNPLIRNLVAQTLMSLDRLVQPYFLIESEQMVEPIPGFTGVNRWGIDRASQQIEQDLERGVRSFLLFGVASQKDPHGSAACKPDGLIAEALRKFKMRFGEAAVFFTDVCLCPYTDHGHCGVLGEKGVENEPTLGLLSQMALCHAQAGADFVAPSDMMDGRVHAIRSYLDVAGYSDTGILSYTAKYHSAYYGPFRDALDCAPRQGDRASYQMDFRNAKEAMRELELDEQEGADIVLVKPALAYLDVIHRLSSATTLPVAAYHVSGEYEMVKQLAALGRVNEEKMVMENLTAMFRAGAQLVITYNASEIAEKGWLK